MAQIYGSPTSLEFEQTWAARTGHCLQKDFLDRLDGQTGRSKWVAPFQFTINLCAAIYADLQGDDFAVRNGTSPPCQAKVKLAARIRDEPPLSFPDPFDPDERLETPIRAVEFLSWEEATRVFLARRIYPIYFDFMSYSSCHERWGAVGHMLEKISGNSEAAPPISEDQFSRRALPFLREAKRLKFNAIFTSPVYSRTPKNVSEKKSSNLLGAYVVFLKDREYLPENILGYETEDFLQLRRYFEGVGEITKDILNTQSKMLGYRRDLQFRSVWNGVESPDEHPLFYQVEIRLQNANLKYKNFVSDLLSQLSLADQFVVEDRSEINEGAFEFLMVPSDYASALSHKEKASSCKARITEALFRLTEPGDVVSISVRPSNRV